MISSFRSKSTYASLTVATSRRGRDLSLKYRLSTGPSFVLRSRLAKQKKIPQRDLPRLIVLAKETQGHREFSHTRFEAARYRRTRCSARRTIDIPNWIFQHRRFFFLSCSNLSLPPSLRKFPNNNHQLPHPRVSKSQFPSQLVRKRHVVAERADESREGGEAEEDFEEG